MRPWSEALLVAGSGIAPTGFAAISWNSVPQRHCVPISSPLVAFIHRLHGYRRRGSTSVMPGPIPDYCHAARVTCGTAQQAARKSPSAMRHHQTPRTQLPQPFGIEFEAEIINSISTTPDLAKCRINSHQVTSRSPHGGSPTCNQVAKYRKCQPRRTAMGTISLPNRDKSAPESAYGYP